MMTRRRLIFFLAFLHSRDIILQSDFIKRNELSKGFDDMKLDGRKVQNEIARRQLTIRDFAKQAGLPTSTLYRAIGGGHSTTKTAGKIAAALKLNPADIFSPAQILNVNGEDPF